MNKIEATFRIVTPMFMGGADPEIQAELRPPSIKGALRFWYRAIDSEYKAHESRIFGGNEEGSGQSLFLLWIKDQQKIAYGDRGDSRWHNSHIAYLGYGAIVNEKTGETIRDKYGNLKEVKKQITVRRYIKNGGKFTIVIQFKPMKSNATEKEQKEYIADVARVKKAFWAFVMFGGVGARSRKGFGSLMIERIIGMGELPDLIFKNRKQLFKALNEYLKDIDKADGLPDYTSWSNQSRCLVIERNESALDALQWLGGELKELRLSSGINKFDWVKGDCKLMDKYIHHGICPTSPPSRAVFGLPHNYFFMQTKKGGEVNYMVGDKKGCRASPLFFHIHEFVNHQSKKNTTCIIASYLPAEFLPNEKKIMLSAEGQKNISLKLGDDFTPITDILDEFVCRSWQEVTI